MSIEQQDLSVGQTNDQVTGEICPQCGEGIIEDSSHSSCGICNNCFYSPCS